MGRRHNNRVDNVLVMISPELNQPLLYFADAVRVCLRVVAHIPIQLTALTFSCSETTNQAEKKSGGSLYAASRQFHESCVQVHCTAC